MHILQKLLLQENLALLMNEKLTKSSYLKLLFGLALILFLVIRYLDQDIHLSSINIDYNLLLIGMLLVVISFVFMILKLHLVITDYVKNILESMKLFFISWFFSNLLPTNMGGDLYLIDCLRKRTRSLSKATAFISIQRIIPIVLILVYAIIYSIIRPKLLLRILVLNSNLSFVKIILSFIVFLSVIMMFLYLFRLKFKKWKEKIRNFINNYFESLLGISTIFYIKLILYSLIFQTMRMTGIYIILLGMNQNLNLLDLFFILISVTLLSMIPLSIGALGIQESCIVFGLQLLNVPIHIGILVAFLYRGIFILFAIVGGIILLFSKRKQYSR